MKQGVWNELLSEAMFHLSLNCIRESLDFLTQSLGFVTMPATWIPKGESEALLLLQESVSPRWLIISHLILRKITIFPIAPKHLNINYFFFMNLTMFVLALEGRTRTGRLQVKSLVPPALRREKGWDCGVNNSLISWKNHSEVNVKTVNILKILVDYTGLCYSCFSFLFFNMKKFVNTNKKNSDRTSD